MSGEQEVQRYDLFDHIEHGATMSPDDQGAYVTHADHVRVVEGLRAERAVFNTTIDEVQAGWRECQSALRHAEELLANQIKETEARRSERDAALLRVGEAEGMLREAMPWLGEWARAEGITERIEGFLGGVGEGP